MKRYWHSAASPEPGGGAFNAPAPRDDDIIAHVLNEARKNKDELDDYF